MSDYPEHEKMHKVVDESQKIGEFLEWLGTQGWEITEYNQGTNYFVPISLRIEQILAKYYCIPLWLWAS